MQNNMQAPIFIFYELCIYSPTLKVGLYWIWSSVCHSFITDDVVPSSISFSFSFLRTNGQNLTEFCIHIDIADI